MDRNPEPVANAIYPTLGPAIRKAISEALAGFADTLNRAIDSSLSPRGLRWRFESWRSGVPYAQLVLRDSLVYQVEQVFLIHGDTGLLLAHAVAADAHGTDGDLVSSMLTAIRDFVADSFETSGDGGLKRFTVGERSVLVEPGPHMAVAAVVRGQPPAALLERLQETLETLHTQFRRRLQNFDGDNAPFSTAVPTLEDCLDTVLSTEQGASRSNAPRVAWALVGLVVIVLAVLGYRSLTRWNRATALLAAQPGIVLLEADHGWRRSTVSGLRDPLSAEPSVLLAGAGIDPTRLEEHWRPFLSLDPAIVERRAVQQLHPPDTVTLVLDADEGVLRARGAAAPVWLAQTRAAVVPGAAVLDLSGVEMVRSAALEQTVARLEARQILFPIASAVLDAGASQDGLRGVAADYQQLAELAGSEGWHLELTMVGRADPSGSAERNNLLSMERSQAVRDALLALGVPTETVRVAGLGGSAPLPAADVERRGEINRSVSFTVSLTDAASTP